MDSNKLALLANQLGGFDELSELLGVDEDLLQKAISGENLTRQEIAEIDKNYSELVLDEEKQDLYSIDLDVLDSQGEILDRVGNFIYNQDLADSFRESFANGQVTYEILENAYGLFAELSTHQTERLINYLEEGGNADIFLQLYIDDGDIWDIEDSDFWDWFREIFYSDD